MAQVLQNEGILAKVCDVRGIFPFGKYLALTKLERLESFAIQQFVGFIVFDLPEYLKL